MLIRHDDFTLFRFPGQYFDQESGIHYNLHRYYDPEIGKYLTPDPIGTAGGINTFVYSQNNPIRFIDPLGLAHWEIGGGFSFSLPGYHFSTSMSSEVCCDDNNRKHVRTIQTTCWGFSLGASIGGGNGPGAGTLNRVISIKKCKGRLGDVYTFETGFGFSSAILGGGSWASSDPTTMTIVTGLGLDLKFWSQCKTVVKQDVIGGRCCEK